MNLNDLPDEVLCTIFDNLDVYELKLASLVCRRWSDLTFSGQRMDRVLLKYDCDFLLNTKRKYRNLRLTSSLRDDDQIESLVRLPHTIKPHVRMLDIQCAVTNEELRLILLEVPALQHLLIDNCSDQNYRKKNAPSRVLPKLKSPNRQQLFSFFRTNIPNLQCLNMPCTTDLELAAWKILSAQLQLVHVNCSVQKYLHSFLGLTFPFLEDLDMFGTLRFKPINKTAASASHGFFRRHPFLRRLSFSIVISAELVEIITRHCPELTYLSLCVDYPKKGHLESLVQLKHLKHLSLEGEVEKKILRGAMSSLESVRLHMSYPEVLLKNLFEVVPRLSSLQIKKCISCDALQFICKKFSCLRRLELFIDDETFHPDCEDLEFPSFDLSPVADDFVRFDRLVHLQELKLKGHFEIRFIHPNNVRCLTLSCFSYNYLGDIMIDDFYEIPEKFPLLKRLILKNWASSDCVAEELHELMPSCRIDYDNQRFYPVDDGKAD